MDVSSLLAKQLWLHPDISHPPGTDHSQHRRSWGFTLYRTSYTTAGGPSSSSSSSSSASDTAWHTLVSTIRDRTLSGLSVRGESESGSAPNRHTALADAESLACLFRLDPRSDQPTLQDRTLSDLRPLYKHARIPGGAPMNALPGFELRQRRLFLVADDEVLNGDLSWVKCVEVDYEAARHAAHPRMGPQRYFGWMKLRVEALLPLWVETEVRGIDQIAPRTVSGRHDEVWGDDIPWW